MPGDAPAVRGHHRVRACAELGITDWPKTVRTYDDELARRTQARRLNIARRHLDTAAKRALIEAELKDRPDVSNRAIAADLGVDDKTVGNVRTALIANAEIPHSTERKEASGKNARGKKPAPPRVTAVSVPKFNLASQKKDAPNRTSFTGDNEWYTPAPVSFRDS